MFEELGFLPEKEMITVTWINSDGRGVITKVEVEKGTSLSDFLKSNLDSSPDKFVIRVNHEPSRGSQALKDGDRISATVPKVEGAQ